MSRRSSRSSKSTKWNYTSKLAQADISLVFADSIQVGTSPGVAAATLPRQSVSPASDNLSDASPLERDKPQDKFPSFSTSRSNNGLLSNMYLSKWRQNPSAIPRTERIIQPEICTTTESPQSGPSGGESHTTPSLSTTDTSTATVPDPMPDTTRPDSVGNSTSPKAPAPDPKLTDRTILNQSPTTNITGSMLSPKDAEESVVHKDPNHPKRNISINNEPELANSAPVDSVVKEATSGVSDNHSLQSDNGSNQVHGNPTHSAVAATLTTDKYPPRSDNSSSLRSYLPNSLLPRQIFLLGSEKEVQSKIRKEEDPPLLVPNDNTVAVPQGSTEDLPDNISAKSTPVEKPVAQPSITWSDYLRFAISASPSTSEPVLPPSSNPNESPVHPDIVAVLPSPLKTSNGSWLAPWTWWYSNSQPNSTTESIQVPVEPKIDSESSQETTRAIHISPDPIKSIGTNDGTRTGWLSVLASTNARRRAVKEQGETMEVMLVDEGLPANANPPALDSKIIQPDSRSRMTDRILDSVNSKQRDVSAASSRVSTTPQLPDYLILPTFEDTFCNPPRSVALPKEDSTLHRTVNYVAKILFSDDSKGKGKEKEPFGRELPKAWSVLGEDLDGELQKIKRVVVVGIHGWFPGALIRQVLGEPTGTSEKLATMLERTVQEYFDEHGITLEKLTKISLEGGGTVAQRVNNLFQEYLNHEDWVNDLQTADAILFGTHSQGSIVTTEFVDRLIKEGHIRTPNSSLLSSLSAPQRVGVLALCGVHNGPLLYLNTSTLTNPYIQYFESAAARELFEFQDSESPASKSYVTALSNCLHHTVKFTYIASLNDQVVPIYSGAFVTATHPLILRALYIDGDAYHSTDFLSNLLILLFKIRNAGLHDSGLIAHLSEATAGSLTGVGHSKAYEAPASYKLAVRFLFETSGVIGSNHDLIVEPFTARAARNDYEIPWALRDLIANPDVAGLFAPEFSSLRSAFDDWHPRTTILRDIRRKLEPIRRLNTTKL